MDENLKTGGDPSSAMASMNSPSPKLDTSSEFRMLTPSELELLRLKQDEIRFVALARQVAKEAQSAYASWANWKAIAKIHGSNEQIAAAIQRFPAVIDTQRALARDATLLAYRLTDPVLSNQSESNLTLPALALALDRPGLVTFLTNPARSLEKVGSALVSERTAMDVQVSIERFRSVVVSDWRVARPRDVQLLKLREIIRPLRNRLVHSMAKESESEQLDEPLIHQVESFIELILELAIDMEFVAVRSATSTESVRGMLDEAAMRWWTSAFADGVRELEKGRV
jgi:hypothetical protein